MSQDIFKELRIDHDIQRDLIKTLTKTEGDSDQRKRIFYDLKHELEEHAKHEERYFYKPLLDSDNTQDKARHSIAEHKELDDFLEELSTTDMSSSSWLKTAKKLEDRLIHHLDEEEKEVFPMAGKELNKTQKESLGAEYSKEMKQENCRN